VFILITLLGFGWVSEVALPDLGPSKKRRTLAEIKEFREMVADLLREEFVEVAPDIKIRKGCKIERGIASWYGGRFHGRKTANGEIYDLFKFTAASRTLPLGTYVLVRNEENGRVQAGDDVGRYSHGSGHTPKMSGSRITHKALRRDNP